MKLSVLLLAVIASFAAACSTDNIPDNVKRQYKYMFDQMDTDHSGYIDPADAHAPIKMGVNKAQGVLGQLLNMVPGLSTAISTAELMGEKALLAKLSKAGRHKVSLCEFETLMYQSQKASTMMAGKFSGLSSIFDDDSDSAGPVVVHG